MISLKLSGNYILEIYPVGNPENPAITQRFIITEDAVNINVTTHRPQMTKDNNTQQQVDFTVNYTGQNIIDPYRNPRDRYDRLIGAVIANTLNRLAN